jgi:hypothetical protein
VTVRKIPSRRVDIDEFICDHCKRTTQVREGDKPPWPWVEIEVPGWVGCFHGCCEGCALLVRNSKTLPVKTVPES